MSFLYIRIWPWGQVNVKWVGNSLFSERHGHVPTMVIGRIRLTWRRWRRSSQ